MFNLESSERVINIKAKLNNGRYFPVISFGTYQITGSNNIHKSLDAALRAGYRSIDTAAVYHNEIDIGNSLKKLLPKYCLRREDIFITTKLAPSDHGDEEKVSKSVANSLKNLDTKYIDLYLIHWPAVSGKLPSDHSHITIRTNTWKALESLYNNGNGPLKSIGVSNYTTDHIAQLLMNAKVIPAVNQVEFHPHWQQTKELHDICKKHNILLQAYSPLGTGNQNLLNDQIVKDLAIRNNLKAAQVLLRWALQRNYAIAPKSVTPERIEENSRLDKPLSEEDIQKLNSINGKNKYAWNPEVVR